MIAAIVQRPNILDILEIRSNTSCVIRYWVVEDGRVQNAPTHEPVYTQRYMSIEFRAVEAGFVRCPDSQLCGASASS